MKINVIIALFGSASAIKVESTTSSQFYMPPAMLHKVCATRPKVWKVPATLKCDYKKAEYPQYVEAADGKTCEYACNRQKDCTVENRCLPLPQIHKACATRPAKWSPPSTLKCDYTPATHLRVDYVEAADGTSCDYACNGPLGGCTIENHCLPEPKLHKSCPYKMRPTGYYDNRPKTLTCDATKGLYKDYVEKADGKTCEWACNSSKVCTIFNGCIPAPSLLKTCPLTWAQRPKDFYKSPANKALKCPSNKRKDYVEVSLGPTVCKWECNGQLPCVSGQPKTSQWGQPICDASVPETPAKTTGLPAIGGTAAAATIDATTLGAPAGTATVTYVFYETPNANKTAATQ